VAEDKKPSRGEHGRWVKGVSGNPKGRPKKYAKIDSGDLERFMNTVLEVNTPDGRKVMTREAAIQHRLYQSAMQGEVRAQIFLARRFEKFNEKKGETSAALIHLLARLREEKRDPTEQESLFMTMAQKRLHLEPTAKEIEELKQELRAKRRKRRRERRRKDSSGNPGLKS